MKKILIIMCLLMTNISFANSLLELSDDQFVRLLGKGIPDECVDYYLGDLDDLGDEMNDLKIIDTPGYSARNATEEEKNKTMNTLLGNLEKRCYQDVKRVIVTNNYHQDMPKHLYADDFSDKRVLDRYVVLVKGE